MHNLNNKPQTWGDILFAGAMIALFTALSMAAIYVVGEQLNSAGLNCNRESLKTFCRPAP